MAQFPLMNVKKSAGRITGLHSSISVSFRFTRQSIHCIGQAGLRVGRFARPASKPAGEQTGQNIAVLAVEVVMAVIYVVTVVAMIVVVTVEAVIVLIFVIKKFCFFFNFYEKGVVVGVRSMVSS